jgi:hypothetical protein
LEKEKIKNFNSPTVTTFFDAPFTLLSAKRPQWFVSLVCRTPPQTANSQSVPLPRKQTKKKKRRVLSECIVIWAECMPVGGYAPN